VRRLPRATAGFTLLEVMVALTIVAVAVVSLIELSAHGTRLLKLSTDHQRAVELADRIVRDTDVSEEAVDAGEEGVFAWERRVALVPMPEELENRSAPGREGGPRLFSVSVAVRWGRGQTVEVATLRAPSPPPQIEAEGPAQTGSEPGTPQSGGPSTRSPGGSSSGRSGSGGPGAGSGLSGGPGAGSGLSGGPGAGSGSRSGSSSRSVR
jgi:prepilin-type N-terminal cleavage/methylation domain-containing protein